MRPPVPDVENSSTDDLDQILALELRPREEALEALRNAMGADEWKGVHPDVPDDTDAFEQLVLDQYYRILRDNELVRVPMEFGAPSASPARMRNPARGFLDLRKEVVVALCDVGHLRWGACDFGLAQSGDMMHFDLGHHGAEPA